MSTRRIFGGTLLAATLLATSLAAQGVEKEAHRARWISLNSHDIDVTAPPEKIPAHLVARAAASGLDEILLVKFPGPVTARQLAALNASGARIYTYLPYDTYLVRMPATAAEHGKALRTITGAAGAIWTGPYHPYYKISRFVSGISGVTPEEKAGRFQSVMVDIFPDADLGKVVDQIKDLGVQGVVGAKQGSFFSRVRLLLSPKEIVRFRDDLAQIPEVFWLDLEPRRELLNDTTIWVGQSGLSAGQTTPVFSHGIFGEGQTVAVIDTGIDADMCYFRDTTKGLPPTNLCNGGTVVDNTQRKVIAVDFLTASECSGGIGSTEWDTQNHGTHVAGTVAGDNFANLLTHDTADGMAPGAKLVIQDAGFLTDNCGDLPGIGCPVVDLKPIFLQAFTQGARLHTNSWGDNENGAVQNNYTAASQDVDQFMWDHKDDLIFFAAGNAGPGTGTVGSPSTNKNGVSVGATLRGTSANSMASFSSCGPTDDGRVKPDLTVPGSSIVSAGNDGNITTNNCGTRTMSGTSMASPGAAGLTALVRQYYIDGWYPSGTKTPANGFTPSNALLKATVVNSAQAMTGTGTTPIPSNCQGWGRMLLDDALFFNTDARKLQVVDDSTGFASGSVNVDKTFTYTVNSNTQSLKVTLAWTDFPSTPAANPHLNNDLDLIVTGPGGTFKGNVFSSGVSVTGGNADRRNNLEQVFLTVPAAGTYTVTVRAINVPNGPQPFALVVTGDLSTGGNPPVTVFFDDFETSKGWTTNPNGTDTATTGQWERAVPQATNSNGPKQLATTPSGTNDLVTGHLAGAAAGDFDVDGGTTSIQSPPINLPSTGNLTLSFSFYFAHGSNSSSADFFRVEVVGATTTTVFQVLGSATDVDAAFAVQSVSLNAFAGQTVRIRISAADASTASLVEAAVDDVKIVQQ
jgi:subtilisin family serine protease